MKKQADRIGNWVREFQRGTRTKKRAMLREVRRGGIELILELNAQDVPWTPRDTFDAVLVAADVFAEELWGMRGSFGLFGDIVSTLFADTLAPKATPKPAPCGCH